MKKFLAAITLIGIMTTQLMAGTALNKDSEVANVVMTANAEEMNLATLAKNKAQNQSVKDFASMMYKAHAKNNDQATALAEKEHLALKETDPSMIIKFGSEDKIERLKHLKGKQFDRAYMETQVDLHKKILDRFDSTLIPIAKNPELKAMLQKTRKDVESHLRHAEKINNSLI